MIFERILGIAACDPKGVIGNKGGLPWHCPDDLRHFADTTLNSPMIMGYKTFVSLPDRYFHERVTIVFTRKKLRSKHPLLLFVPSLKEFLALEEAFKDLYVIGGAEIYNLFIQENLIRELILTKMKNLYEGDTFFPLSLLEDWSNCKICEEETYSIHQYKNPFSYAHKNL